ncbi:MAG: hypothetical protein AAGA99_24520 [Actinomycetota bacterium]
MPDHIDAPQTTIDSRPRRRLVGAAVLAAAVVLGACGTGGSGDEEASAATIASLPGEDGDTADGDGDGGSGGDADPPTDEEIEAAQIEFERCMADAGIDLSGPSDSASIEGGDDDEVQSFELGEGESFEDLEAAMEQCDSILEDTFGSFEPSPEEQAELADAEAAFANCMTDAGFEISNEDGAIAIGSDGEDDEAVEAALDDCSEQAFGQFDDAEEN